ncbi:hypothetical protein Ahy_A02g005920 [Arachis hypogaea]|uniref:Beta-glucosidase n=1 Tax=Arachis hypogaea TaxID=3818 RepID=A0A445E8S4_ARAHY|nr:hypothetical protein Ahy_A02g005920 [Arachis hypogaea]
MQNRASRSKNTKQCTLQDVSRMKYLNGSNIKGYFAWSFLDLFELLDGYKVSHGLYFVDRNNPELKRYPKLSAKWFNWFLRGRRSTSIVAVMKLVKDPSYISI